MKNSIETARHSKHEWQIACALLLTLMITRSGHFGSSFELPDASWAMFWLAGALTTRWWWPTLMLVAAALVDYFVISHGVSSYCVTPAYPFLIPAYLALWFAGRWAASSLTLEVKSLVRIVLSLTLSIAGGVTAAFFISNASFYALSGYFSTLSAWHYAREVVHYWQHYLIDTTVYAGAGLLIRFIIRAAHNVRSLSRVSS